MNNNFKDDEVFYRRVRNKPEFFKDGIPSSALFKDSKGVSVDIRNGRAITEVLLDEERIHANNLGKSSNKEDYRLKAVISVDMKTCDNQNVYIITNELPNNPHHALIQRSQDVIPLTQGQARGLARNAIIEKMYKVT